MDADFQEQYVAAEQAYSASEFDKADDLARPLLGKLEPLPASGAERDATLAWRAFVALLLGHIQRQIERKAQGDDGRAARADRAHQV